MSKKQRVQHPEVAEPPAETWSNCLTVGEQILVAGMTARDGSQVLAGDEYGQARAIFEKIEKLLFAARGSVAGAPGILLRRFPGIDPGRGERAGNARAQG